METGRYHVGVLQKALDVLEAVATRHRVSLRDLSAATGIPKGTLFRIVVNLEERGYLDRSGPRGDVGLGPRALMLGESARRLHASLVQAARPLMAAIRQELGHTINLGVRRGSELVYLDVLEGTGPLRFVELPGATGPLHATALGKALLAWSDEAEVRALLAQRPLQRYTPKTLADAERLLADLRLTRRRGYAVDDEESVPGALCIATPIFGREGLVDAALSVSAPRGQMGAGDRDRAVKLLIDACARLRP